MMQIGILGINHKSADVSLREQFAKACQRRFAPGCSAHPQMAYVLLSTCNRTEVYFSSDDLAVTHSYILNILRVDVSGEFEHRLYSYFGRDCFFHLACVTSGMDSAIIGETEIQGQVKKAYEAAADCCWLSHELHFLFQKCLKIGKDIRSSSSFPIKMPSLEEAIMTASNYLFGNLTGKQLLFVGASEINYKIFSRLKNHSLHQIVFCNRSSIRSEMLAKKEKVDWMPWESLSDWSLFDVIIFGTKSPDYLITHQNAPKAFATPKLLIDLCIPRNVDPHLSRHPQITLLNIDQLHRMIDRKQKLKATEIARLELQEIARAVTRQMIQFRAKESYQYASIVNL